ncbi:MAG: DUF3343 domain-containing protein [Oscillospiraceae bacterium]|nr:DUF3343 domain-containing protein [Oscillospiraceae bacterium]
MFKYIFTFQSLTGAQRGLRILSRAGIAGDIVRQHRSIAKTGCGYGIRVSERWYPPAREALRRAGASYQMIYSVDGAGNYRQVEP